MDPRYNIAYVSFQEKQAEVETIRISDELVVDMAPDGTIYGIELLNANEQLWREDMGRISPAKGILPFPANHVLIAVMNPCTLG